MTKKVPKPGTAAELAAMFPAENQIPVRVTRVAGDGPERKVTIEKSAVTIYALPIEQLGRIVDIFEPILNGMTEPKRVLQFISENKPAVYAAVSEATGWAKEDIGAFNGDDFVAIVFAIFEANRDFFVRLLALGGFAPPTTGIPSNGDGRKPLPSSDVGAMPTPSVTPSMSSTRQ